MASGETPLPENWSETTLGEIGRYLNGRAFKKQEWAKTGRPIIRIQDLTGSNQNPNYFEGEVADRYVVRPGDLLISWSATLGAYIWDGPEGVLNQHIFKVESFINQQFHYHLVRERLSQLMGRAHGSGIVHVTKGTFDSTTVVIPDSLSDQAAIAELLDDIDARQASALDHLRVGRRSLRRFRTAGLSAAFRRASGEAGEHTVTLGSILRDPLRNGYSARPVGHETPFRVLSLSATTTGIFDGTQFKYTEEAPAPHSQNWVSPGDILVQRGNTAEYVGVPAVYNGEPEEFLYPDLMIRVRVRAGIDPRFVWYMLLAPESREYLRRRATGSAGNMPKINQTILNEVPLPMPSAQIRETIVAELDEAFRRASVIERRLETASKAVDRLAPSTLSKAFRGELV